MESLKINLCIYTQFILNEEAKEMNQTKDNFSIHAAWNWNIHIKNEE
jgi:hypothetical protein